MNPIKFLTNVFDLYITEGLLLLLIQILLHKKQTISFKNLMIVFLEHKKTKSELFSFCF